jgi:hypothetical protein
MSILGSVLGIGLPILGELIGGWIGSEGAEDAGGEAYRGYGLAMKALEDWFEKGGAALEPYMTGGKTGLADYIRMYQEGPPSFDPTRRPEYQHGMEKLREWGERTYGVKPTGRTLQALGERTAGFVGNLYGSHLQEYYDTLLPPFRLAQLGLGPTQQYAQGAWNTGSQLAGLTANQGLALANMEANKANIWGDAVSGAFGWGMQPFIGSNLATASRGSGFEGSSWANHPGMLNKYRSQMFGRS